MYEGVWWDGRLQREWLNSPGGSGWGTNVMITRVLGDRLCEFSQESSWATHGGTGTRPAFMGDITGDWREEIILAKDAVSIIENPLFAIMNEPNSTLQRLIRKISLLDYLDEQSGTGKLDLILQLPYVIKTEARRKEAERRRNEIEQQLSNSKYGIAYTDGTEKITQLNRSVENNLFNQIKDLTSTLYNQLGLTETIFNGTADEATMLNYYNRTIEPILSAITNEMKRKFLTLAARTQGQSFSLFRDPFKLVPTDKIADIADKFTRAQILSPNELRAIVGYKPVDDARADELRNPNLNEPVGEYAEPPINTSGYQEDYDDGYEDDYG